MEILQKKRFGSQCTCGACSAGGAGRSPRRIARPGRTAALRPRPTGLPGGDDPQLLPSQPSALAGSARARAAEVAPVAEGHDRGHPAGMPGEGASQSCPGPFPGSRTGSSIAFGSD